MPTCFICQRSVHEAPLYRANQKGEPAVWCCAQCHPTPESIDAETRRLVNILAERTPGHKE